MNNPWVSFVEQGKYYLANGFNSLYQGFAKLYQAPNKHLVLQVSDSVGFLVINTDTDEILLVKQSRMPMMRPDNPKGEIVESPAGRFDYKTTPCELIASEAGEEVGVTIAPKDVIMLNGGIPLALSPGIITERMYLGLVFVSNEQIELEDRVFGVDSDEHITRIKLKVKDLEIYLFEDLKTFALYNAYRIYQMEQGK